MANTDRLLKLAQSLMEKHRWRKAVQLLKEDSALLKKDWKLLWNLGWSYFKLERMDDAGKYLKRAANLATVVLRCEIGSSFQIFSRIIHSFEFEVGHSEIPKQLPVFLVQGRVFLQQLDRLSPTVFFH